eukprot:7883809-Alexandrium_andersonii.AAC.1
MWRVAALRVGLGKHQWAHGWCGQSRRVVATTAPSFAAPGTIAVDAIHLLRCPRIAFADRLQRLAY